VFLCGGIKNVFAIASGIISGLTANESTKMLFIHNILTNIEEIIVLLGGKKETVYSLSGIGDLLLTCLSSKSRNFQFGYLLSKNRKDAIVYFNTNTVEGVYTLNTISKILELKNVENKLISLLKNIIFSNTNPNSLIEYLMN